MASVVNAYKLAFQDSSQVKESFREGFISRNAMADWYENDRTWTMSNGSDVTATVDASSGVVDGTNVHHHHQRHDAFGRPGLHGCRHLCLPPGDEAGVSAPPAIHLPRR
jgi:hypothetical protein